MGKRKERRLAAMNNAGRRVKLDLFAEPSDLGGSSVQEEIDGEPKRLAGLPKSPSSPGQQPPNPLLLLGQYSDDELDEESNTKQEHGTLDGSFSDHDDQGKGPLSETCKDTEVDAGESLDTLKVNQQKTEEDSTLNSVLNLVGIDNEGDGYVTNESVENDSIKQDSFAGTSEVQVTQNVGSGWRIVMDEESNQYYYWNTETGETSWELPAVLNNLNQSTSHLKAPSAEDMEVAQVDAHDLNSTVSAQSIADNVILQSNVYDNEPELDEPVGAGGCKNKVLKDKISDVSRSDFQSSLDAVDTCLSGGSLDHSGNSTHDVLANDDDETETDLPIHLLRQGECLLERLKSLKVSEDNLQGQGWMSKCILEVEIRLSDIKSLLSYESSLTPFWTHCERQLKWLEGVINDKIYQLANSAIMEEAEEAPNSFEEKLNIKEVKCNEVEADGALNKSASALNTSQLSINGAALTVGFSDVNNQVPSINAAHMVHVSSFGSPTEHCELDDEEISKTGVNDQEEDDMDVDMEVEDAMPPSTVVLRDVPPNILEQLKPSADYSAVPPPPNEEWIPPPPDTEQIPPPPPNIEQVPPPPPDEPPEYPLPPSHTPLTYAEQYNLTYSDPGYQYYGHAVNQIPIGGFYGHADGSQIAVAKASLYFQAVPNTYSESVSVSVNSVEPVIFYDLQGRRASSVPIASGTESFQLHSEMGTISSNTIASNQVGPGGDIALAEPGLRADDPTVNEKTEVASVGSSSTFAAIVAPATVSVKESSAAAAASMASVTSSSAPKAQSKAARTKKKTVAVTSSLRSNKKVSSLVDKWKAVKEELQEDAKDEPENANEILEQKRKQEIAECYAQQLASGEAKYNANFQPLGGDWREKVKRRRAQKAKESPEASSEALPDGNQQPDLDELSRGLPAGWQAYRDEASKQIYYVNVNTSETTWIRPTK
ncbi:formin-binding protein 4-like isoform X2 [Hibiscus syriacus]|uniref:formin-binding protein 4-like isoform X2 n=1 Tax=Hibiscus syriacus TaxID=106335 RepID=UPI001923CFF5|nr:formin-binding protein 4-like isoform X2 [Hibiscus syriacus]